MESLPQGAANTDLDNESYIREESEPKDIDDTPTSVRMVCFVSISCTFLKPSLSKPHR